MKRTTINPQLVFWPIADAIRAIVKRRPLARQRLFVKRQLAILVKTSGKDVKPMNAKVMETYVSKILRLAFPVSPAALKAVDKARAEGKGVNACLRIARGKREGRSAAPKHEGGAKKTKLNFAAELHKLIASAKTAGMKNDRVRRVLQRNLEGMKA